MMSELLLLAKAIGWVLVIGFAAFIVAWPILDLFIPDLPFSDDEDEWPNE